MIFVVRPTVHNLFIRSICNCAGSDRGLLENIQKGVSIKIFEANIAIKQLIKNGHLSDARNLFDKMPHRDQISWTTMISGYVSGSNSHEALLLFAQMLVDSTVKVDSFVLSLVLKACGSSLQLNFGESIHGHSIKTGFVNSVFVGSSLLDMYSKTGTTLRAQKVFDEMPQRNVVSWTAIITGLVRDGNQNEALAYFSDMLKSNGECDSYTFAIALKACADSYSLRHGKEIHTQVLKLGFSSSSFVANTLVTVYNKCGKLSYAMRLFEKMKIHDVISWTSIIVSYVQMGGAEKALELFVQMRKSDVIPNEFTLAAVLSGCADLANISLGEQLHGHVLRMGLSSSMSVANSITTMYSKCGSLTSALSVFGDMKEKDLVSWSAMIAGFSQEGHGKEAFETFTKMRRSGSMPNEFTFASLLTVCADMASLKLGKQIHAHVFSLGMHQDPAINSGLINMYSKCGSIEEASQVFERIVIQDIVSWTAMINGFAEHGYSQEAINLFQKMPFHGLTPDHVTFIGVLTACSHAGLADLGFKYFNSMSTEYSISPRKEHYGCIVDLLCRAGRIIDAENMISTMPFQPDEVVWSTVLRGSRVHGNVESGQRMAKQILQFDPKCAGTHITLSNIYASKGRWRDAANIRKLMQSKGVRKEPGWSLIEVNDKAFAFVAGDRSHPQGDNIYAMLDLLASREKIDTFISQSGQC